MKTEEEAKRKKEILSDILMNIVFNKDGEK